MVYFINVSPQIIKQPPTITRKLFSDHTKKLLHSQWRFHRLRVVAGSLNIYCGSLNISGYHFESFDRLNKSHNNCYQQ